MKKNINGYAKWILVVLAILTIAYNSVATHVIAKNEVKHLRMSVDKIETLLIEHLIKHK